MNLRDEMKESKFFKEIKVNLKKENKFDNYIINEIKQFKFRFINRKKMRINLLTTSVNKKDIFAGIKTAMDFSLNLSSFFSADIRIIAMDNPVKDESFPKNFKLDSASSEKSNIIVDMSSRSDELVVSKNDVFIATMWHTAYAIKELLEKYKEKYKVQPYLVYLIQDFEPNFFPWSARYLLADSTYTLKSINTIAIFNSKQLYDYFKNLGYEFYRSYYFSPKLNDSLKHILLNTNSNRIVRKNQILIYGRPTKQRNAFSLILMALDKWYRKNKSAADWQVISAGEYFGTIECPSGLKIRSLGKLSIEDYAKTMLKTKIGISLMVSPHPSYPPLEMSVFGVKVITNMFANKDLSKFNENIYSIKDPSIESLVGTLEYYTKKDNLNNILIKEGNYLKSNQNQWNEIFMDLKKILRVGE